MVYQWYSYYLIPFYLFPIFQIWMAAKLGTRNVFKPAYQLLMWPQALIIPIFVKGYDDNFLQLTPNILVHSIIIPALIGVFLIYSLCQHFFGPRFFLLAIFFPPPHKYLVPIKNIKSSNPDDNLCPICYGDLEVDPQQMGTTVVADENEDNPAQRPLVAKPLKKCMATPCKHYYHSSCLKQWMNQKMECPTCRAELPAY